MENVTSTLQPAAGELPAPGAVLELLKPVTWFPPMWAFGCGVVSTGVPPGSQPLVLAIGLVLVGPLVCASSQVTNDWFDRHVDALNEPNRPIPSGRIPGRWGLYLALFWTALSLLAGSLLGAWGFGATVVALLLAWAYSAPPIRLKQNGWYGNAAVGFTYEGLAWVTGAAVMLGGQAPPLEVVVLAVLYSLGAHGIMTLNDFKSIEGDRLMGIGSLPARLGAERSARVACVAMVVPQLAVVAVLFAWDAAVHGAAVSVLLAVQILLMRRFLARPVDRALWYSAVGVPVYVLGMLVSAFAIRGGVTT
jgi:chlorophyll/bacteriochlorophyll a synthase